MNSTAAADPLAATLALPLLRNQVAAILRAAGLRQADSELVADSLSEAEARGIASHGVNRTRIYAERARAGLLNTEGEPRVLRASDGGILIDADNSIGHVGALAGIEAGIARCKTAASVTVGIRNSNHCGTLAFFCRRATDAGLAVIAMSTAPVTMVYFGGKTRAVGTNPLCIGIPRANAGPIMIDMATSATARGKIIIAEKLGTPIPAHWAVDVDGRPTSDPTAALTGSMVPFAGPKGSGLAMAIDLLAGAMISGLTGPDIGDMYEDWTRPQRVSHLFMVMNPSFWTDDDGFETKTAAFADWVHDLPPADSFDQVLLPGEVEDRAYARAVRQGVTVPKAVLDDLDSLAREVGATSLIPRTSPGLQSTPTEGRRSQ